MTGQHRASGHGGPTQGHRRRTRHAADGPAHRDQPHRLQRRLTLPVRHLPDHRGLRIGHRRPTPPGSKFVLLFILTSQYAISAYVFNFLKDPFSNPFDG